MSDVHRRRWLTLGTHWYQCQCGLLYSGCTSKICADTATPVVHGCIWQLCQVCVRSAVKLVTVSHVLEKPAEECCKYQITISVVGIGISLYGNASAQFVKVISVHPWLIPWCFECQKWQNMDLNANLQCIWASPSCLQLTPTHHWRHKCRYLKNPKIIVTLWNIYTFTVWDENGFRPVSYTYRLPQGCSILKCSGNWCGLYIVCVSCKSQPAGEFHLGGNPGSRSPPLE